MNNQNLQKSKPRNQPYFIVSTPYCLALGHMYVHGQGWHRVGKLVTRMVCLLGNVYASLRPTYLSSHTLHYCTFGFCCDQHTSWIHPRTNMQCTYSWCGILWSVAAFWSSIVLCVQLPVNTVYIPYGVDMNSLLSAPVG